MTNQQTAIDDNLTQWANQPINALEILRSPTRAFSLNLPDGPADKQLRMIHHVFAKMPFTHGNGVDDEGAFARSVTNSIKANLPFLEEALAAFVINLENKVADLIRAGATDPTVIVPSILPAASIVQMNGGQTLPTHSGAVIPIVLVGVRIDLLPADHALKQLLPAEKLLGGQTLVLGTARREERFGNMRYVPRHFYRTDDAVQQTTARREAELEKLRHDEMLERQREERERNAAMNRAVTRGEVERLEARLNALTKGRSS